MAFGREIQIVPTCVSADGVHTQDIIAVIAASAAVTISDIPFHGPVAACRVAYLNGEYVVNPTFAQIEKADLEIVVAGTAEGFTMVKDDMPLPTRIIQKKMSLNFYKSSRCDKYRCSS